MTPGHATLVQLALSAGIGDSAEEAIRHVNKALNGAPLDDEFVKQEAAAFRVNARRGYELFLNRMLGHDPH